MAKEESEFAREKRIENEATHWVAREFAGFSPSEQDEFFEWLAADPSHSEAYVKYQDLWGSMDTLAEWAPEHSEKPHRDLLKDKPSIYQWMWMGGLAAMLILGAFLWLPQKLGRSEADPQHFVANAYESYELLDGSIVEMKRGAAIRVDFTPNERRVELVSSEALFNVKKDENRPFIVTAKGVEVRAVGTAFNVRVSENEIQVLVTEGTVRLGSRGKIFESSQEIIESKPILDDLVAGQLSRISLDTESLTPVVVQADEEAILEELDWKYRLDFNSIPLYEAVEQINRRGAIELVIADETLNNLPIVATLRIDRLDHFVELLEISFGIESETDSRGRVLLTASNDSI